MKILTRLSVPTGDILTVEGENGKLECLSLGDYGKEKNLVADFLGLSREISHVEHGALLPLEEKWVCTISSQMGCNMFCKFCDVPKVKVQDRKNINASFKDLIGQVKTCLNLHPEVKYCEHFNVHFARMGEPSWNPNVLFAASWLRELMDDIPFKIHPVVSTMMPKKNEWLDVFIENWMQIKNRRFLGDAGLQLSINSTNEKERDYMFSSSSLSLSDIAKITNKIKPIGRKITLNFAIAGYEIDPEVLLNYFNPEYYLIKLTPMHKTNTAINNNIKTEGDCTTYHPYKEIKDRLTKAGYDVLVFIASKEEDESLITCGNAILSGSLPTVDYKVIS